MDGRTFRKPKRKKKQTACGKTRYRDRKEANVALANIRTLGKDRGAVPRRVYKCDNCNGGFHLTSEEYLTYVKYQQRGKRSTHKEAGTS